MRRVVVTGMGIASPLGIGVEHVWKRLITGESGITTITSFDTTELTVHFRIGGMAMVGYADGSAGCLPMMPGTLDPRLPIANIGRIDPALMTPN